MKERKNICSLFNCENSLLSDDADIQIHTPSLFMYTKHLNIYVHRIRNVIEFLGFFLKIWRHRDYNILQHFS